jgi:sugar/nucleoside kinase (ribokinase family)
MYPACWWAIVALAMMGIRVSLAQLVGSDFGGRFRAELQRQGIDCAAINIELLQ